MVAFEKLEAARGLAYLKRGGTLIVDEKQIEPLPVLMGTLQYPDAIIEELKAKVEHVIVLNAAKIAEELGSAKAQNIVLLGSLVAHLGLEGTDWKAVIEKSVPAKAIEINKKAFDKGLAFYKQSVR